MNESQARFNISISEYEEKRHVFDMWRWINRTLQSMEQMDNFSTIYFERKGENVKKLIEEAIPTAYLGLHLFRKADDVYIECKAGNQPFDAMLDVVGFRNFSIKVEVTTTEDDVTNMRRQAVARDGRAFFNGPVHREGRNIIFEPEMEDVLEEEQRWIDRAFDRFVQKAESGRYDKETAILVCVDTHRTWRMQSRTELSTRTYDYLIQNHPAVYGVYYCYIGDFIIDEVKESSHWLR